MPSVPFCNLDDAYGSGWKPKQYENTMKKKLQNNIETDNFPNDPRKNIIKGSSEDDQNSNPNLLKNQIDEIPNKQFVKNFEQAQQEAQVYENKMQLPNLNTFNNAATCMMRNNQFQNAAAQDILNVSQNPLNTYGGPVYQMPRQQFGGIAPQYPYNQYPYNQYPYNQVMMYPNNTLPIYQDPNMWPQQIWNVQNNPNPYEMVDPYNRPFNFYNQEVLDNSKYVVEHFGNGPVQTQKQGPNDRLLQLILIVLMLSFVLQIVELILA
jgi:hypothetical protein